MQKVKGETVWLPVQAGHSLAYGRLLDRGVRRVTVHPKGGSKYRDRIHRYRFELVRQDRRARTYVLRGGPLANVALSEENAQDLGDFGAGVTSLDFDGRRAAYSWGYRSEGCPIEHGAENPYASTVVLEKGRQRIRLARSCRSGPAGFLSSVDLVGSSAAWLHLTPGTSANLSTPYIGRGRAGREATETPVAPPAPMSVLSSSVDGQTRWSVLTDGDQVSVTRSPATS